MNFEKAKEFIYKNARPLDLARWKYHFENGSKEDVIRCLYEFQNPDGGFGHALEPDFFNPYSSPVQTFKAMEYLRELDINDKDHPMVKSIIKYLESYKGFDEKNNQWMFQIPSNNKYPHAIWWEYNEDNRSFRYNPTAYIVGFIIKYANNNSKLYSKACSIVIEAFNFLKNADLKDSGDTINCFINLYRFLIETNKRDLFDLNEFKIILEKIITDEICKDTTKYGVEYITMPSKFFENKDALFIDGNEDLINKEIEVLSKLQKEDGAFDIYWTWYTDYKEFEQARLWWRSDLTIRNFIFYNSFKEIKG